MTNNTEKYNRWKANKVAMGFKHYQLFVPEPLIAELKKFIAQWKTDNLHYYERK